MVSQVVIAMSELYEADAMNPELSSEARNQSRALVWLRTRQTDKLVSNRIFLNHDRIAEIHPD